MAVILAVGFSFDRVLVNHMAQFMHASVGPRPAAMGEQL
jgi:hypothetical protein